MKKNGFTIIELLTSFVLTMIIMVFLFEVVIELKDVYVQSDVRTKVTNSNALVATSINNKLDKIPIFSVECNDDNTSCDINSGSSDSLTIGQADDSTIQIGNKSIKMPEGDSIVEDTFEITYNPGSSSKNKHDSYIKIAYEVKGENIDKILDFSYIYTFDMIDRKTGYVYLKPGLHVKNISSGYVSCDDGVLSCNVPIPSVKADDGYTYAFFSREENFNDTEIDNAIRNKNNSNVDYNTNNISINGQGETYYFYAVDDIAPAVSFDSGGSGKYVKNVNNIKINVKDSGSGLKPNQKLYYAWSTDETGANLTDSDYKTVDLKYDNDYQASVSVDASGMNDNLHLCVKGSIEDNWVVPNKVEKPICSPIFEYDNVGPIISFDKNSDTNYSSEKTVKVSVTDNEAGLSDNTSLYYGWSTSDSEEPTDYFKINLDKQAKGDKQVSFDASIKDVSGKYYLWIKPIMVSDALGNITKDIVKTGPFYLDNKAPDIEFVSVDSSFTSDVKVKISDDVSGLASGNQIKYAWSSNPDLLGDNNKEEYDNLSWKSANFDNSDGDLDSIVSLDVSGLNGKYYLYVYGFDVKDVAGNKNTKVVVSTDSYLFDGSAPVISIGKSGCYEYSDEDDATCGVYEEDTWTTSKEIEIDVTDNFDDTAGSGIENGGVIKYGWSTSNKIEPEEYSYHTIDDDDIDSTYSFSISADGLTGEYYLWVVSESVSDLAGNVSNQVVVSSKPYQFDNNPPVIDANYSSTTNSITVVVAANDLESGVENYKYKIGELENENSLKCVKWKDDIVSSSDDDCEQFVSTNDWIDGEDSNVYTFKDLKSDTSYPIKIKVTDAAGNSEILFKEFKTNVLEAPKFSDTGSDVIITYPEGCGSVLECKYIIGDETITVTEKEVKVAYPDSGFITATVSDGINVASASYTVSLDGNTPTISFSPGSQSTYTKSTPVTVNISNSESGLEEIQSVYYAWSESSSTVPTTWAELIITNTDGQKETSVTVPASASSNLTGKYYLWIKWIKAGISEDYEVSEGYKTSGAFYFDNTRPTLSISTSSSTNSITVIAKADAASGIKKYEFSIDGDDWIDNGTNNTYTFDGIESDVDDGAMSIADLVSNAMNNGDGLYADDYEKGKYTYKGASPNNYIQLDDGTLWRIISVDTDGTLKIIRTTSYEIPLPDYLDLDPSDFIPSDLLYLTVPNATWNTGGIEENEETILFSIDDLLHLEKSSSENRTLGLISLTEFLRASDEAGNSCSDIDEFIGRSEYCSITHNWLGSMFQNSGVLSWGVMTLTPLLDEEIDGHNWYIRSNADLSVADKSISYSIFPVVNLRASTYIIGGDGSEGNPYILQGQRAHTVQARVTSGVGLTQTVSEEETLGVLNSATFSESGDIPRTVSITYPEGCGDTLTCSYIKDNGSVVDVTSEAVDVSFSKNGTLIAIVSNGVNEVSSSYTAILDGNTNS